MLRTSKANLAGLWPQGACGADKKDVTAHSIDIILKNLRKIGCLRQRWRGATLEERPARLRRGVRSAALEERSERTLGAALRALRGAVSLTALEGCSPPLGRDATRGSDSVGQDFEKSPAEARLHEGLFVGAMAALVQDGIQFLLQFG
jgi:hypothetical protein